MGTHKQKQEKGSKRLREILHVLRKNDIVRGLDPDKLAKILEELGPTFIKLGQLLSVRSDILPEPYIEALKKLQSDVEPIPYEEVEELIGEAYGQPVSDVFAFFDHKALGSASIAQVHEARFPDGTDVVVKIQRPHIYDLMGRDIMLLKKACRLLKYTPVNGLVDLQGVLDEMWNVAQEEMNFLTEAANLEKFYELNKEVAFVSSPRLYREYTTRSILVMENILGLTVDDKEQLKENGYDLAEIGDKLADNYIKQIIDDGFFHADPHPGNLRIRDGKIVYLDMGMMGTLSEKERRLVGDAVAGVAQKDISACVNAVMGLGIFHHRPNRRKLYRDIELLIDSYGSEDLGELQISKIFRDMIEAMKNNEIEIPSSLTMLMRGLTTLEGVVAELSPDTNIISIFAARISASLFRNMDFQDTLKKDAMTAWKGLHKAVEMPALLSNVLESILKDETYIGMEHHASEDLKLLLRELTSKITVVIICAALFIAAGCAWDNDNLSTLSLALIGLAVIILIISYIRHKKKDK
ncbi:MAG: AarF/ABC1/UbiB kinase family protein [Eubacterium sp.]|nr:AarF/ABC1/UbiB kinase family protein [Eubacterium sp.]